MDFHFLTEAKTRSRWKRETAQQAGQGTWRKHPVTKFGPGVSWRTKVRQMCYDMRVSGEVKKYILQTFEQLERSHGQGYVDKLTDPQLHYAVRQASNSYSTFKKVTAAEHRRSVISGIYHHPTGLTKRTGFEHPDPDVEAGAAKSRTGIGAGDQLRANVADIELGNLTHQELKTHPHPDVKKLYKAITPLKSRLQRDKSVVWSSEGIPYYMFAQMMRTRAEGPEQKGEGPKFYDFLFPRALNFKGKAVPIRQLGKYKKGVSLDLVGEYNKHTKWRNIYRSEELMKLNVSAGTTTVVAVKKDDLQSAAVYAMQVAFQKAKPFVLFREELLHSRAVLEALESIEDKHGFLTKDQEHKRKVAFRTYTQAEKAMKKLGKNYTWYLYLLALEDEHGVLLTSRRSEHPTFPKGRSEVKAHTKYWTVQYAGSETMPKWDQKLLRDAGYLTGNYARFHKDLQLSTYRLTDQSNRAVTQLWMPIVRTLEKFGLHGHPENIDDYIEGARILQAADQYVFGWEGGEISVLPQKGKGGRKLRGVLYTWSGGNPRRKFALIPAMEYLKWFDSPKHSGSRFIHGQKALTAPRREFDPLDPHRLAGRRPAKTKLQQRAGQYQEKKFYRRMEKPEYYPDIFSKDFSYDLEKIRKERVKGTADQIHRNIGRFLKRKQERRTFASRKAERIQKAGRERVRSIQHQMATGQQERATLAKVLAFRHRASRDFPGMSHAMELGPGKYVSAGQRTARERPFTMTSMAPRSGRPTRPVPKRVPMIKVTVKPHVPLPAWHDYLDAPPGKEEDRKKWTWEDSWKKKHPRHKKFLLQKASKQQIKADAQQDYIDKVKSYVRQATLKGFIVIDSSGNAVTLSDLRISKRDLV